MYQSLKHGKPSQKTAATVIMLIKQEADTRHTPEGYRKLNERCGGALDAHLARPEVSLESGDVSICYPAKGPERLIVAGLGKRSRFRNETLRIAAASATRAAEKADITQVGVDIMPGLEDALDETEAGRAFGEGAAIGNLQFEAHKSQPSNSSDARRNSKRKLSLKLEAAGKLGQGIARGLLLGESVNRARLLAATPPNIASPEHVADYCRKLAEQAAGLTCRIIDHKTAAKLGMGGLLGVGAAGSTPPCLIVLDYKPSRGRTPGKQDRPIALVGKAVTFDTGGYSLKPREGMVGMKYDKCGGMAVIGALHAAATLKLPHRVLGIIPTAENMVDRSAMRVDDILTMRNGLTVEVTNTDAEGRLILADAIAWACDEFKPAAVIDLATLTGGVVVALGNDCAGVFCNNRDLRNQLHQAADRSGERLWQLPLWPEHRELMKGSHSDLLNSNGRKAHAIQGAAFLSFFVGEEGRDGWPTLPWAHVDIAGVADAEKATPLYPVGPTGYGVRLLTRMVESWQTPPADDA